MLQIRPFIKYVFISEDMAMRKPQKAYFDMALAEAGVTDRSRCLMVGDSLAADIKGANNAGIDCVWFNPQGLPCTCLLYTSLPSWKAALYPFQVPKAAWRSAAFPRSGRKGGSYGIQYLVKSYK